jgi:hypothetical protein
MGKTVYAEIAEEEVETIEADSDKLEAQDDHRHRIVVSSLSSKVLIAIEHRSISPVLVFRSILPGSRAAGPSNGHSSRSNTLADEGENVLPF